MLMSLDVYYVLGMELNLLSVSQIMRHYPHLDVNLSNHKCHIVDKETEKNIAFGVKDRGLFRLVDSGQVGEHALAAKGASYVNTLWHQWCGHLNLTYLF